MEAGKRELSILLQTGPITPPNSLVRDIEANGGMSTDVRQLGTSLRSGGSVSFIIVTAANIQALAGILQRHTQRLDARGPDDLALLVGGMIDTDEKVVGFRNVRCQRQVSLRGKSEDEIRKLLEEWG